MSMFLAMSGVIGATEEEIEEALRRYALARGAEFYEEPLSPKDDHCLIVSDGINGTTALYPVEFFDWDDASRFLSSDLSKPVFSFHIHDGDFWMYDFFVDGVIVDQFNTVPEYWQELEDDERAAWRGSAEVIARHAVGVSAQDIARYLVQWGDGVLDADERRTAYDDDEYYYGDDWQLCDLMRRLGFDYPVDVRGSVHGKTFRFKCTTD
jgi:hypothetical protein